MKTIKSLIKSRETRNFIMHSLRFVPTPIYISLYYWATTGKRLDLKNPTYFNEKLQWLKINEDYSKYSDYADKIKVRKIINEKLGEGYMFPMIDKWKSFDDIDFDALPEEFVLKCNHDSGSVKLIRHKSELTKRDIDSLRKFYKSRLKLDFYEVGREPSYKNIDRYIFAEEFIKDPSDNEGGIKDYKFFCFNGKPEIMFIATDRVKDVKFDFFDMDFNHLDITNIHPQSGNVIEKPEKFEEMKEMAKKLSAGIKFVRIDLFEVGGKIYFGEYTFFHGGGFNRFYPVEWETRLGNLIDIDTK